MAILQCFVFLKQKQNHTVANEVKMRDTCVLLCPGHDVLQNTPYHETVKKKKKIRRYFHGVTYFTQCQHSEATQRGDRMSSSHFCSWAHHRQHMRGESQQLSPFILKAHRLDMTALIVYVLYLPSHRGIIITFLHFKTHPLSRPRIACCIVTKVLNSTQMHRDIQM